MAPFRRRWVAIDINARASMHKTNLSKQPQLNPAAHVVVSHLFVVAAYNHHHNHQ